MISDLNNIVIIGRLVRDPEIKYTTSGVAVAKFSIANNNSYSKNNQKQEYVNYFDVNVWGAQTVNCEKYLKKGSQVAINGSLRQNRWQDQSTGDTKSKVEITALSVQFLSTSQPSLNSQQPQQTQQNNIPQQNANNVNNAFNNPAQQDPYQNDDEIPF